MASKRLPMPTLPKDVQKNMEQANKTLHKAVDDNHGIGQKVLGGMVNATAKFAKAYTLRQILTQLIMNQGDIACIKFVLELRELLPETEKDDPEAYRKAFKISRDLMNDKYIKRMKDPFFSSFPLPDEVKLPLCALRLENMPHDVELRNIYTIIEDNGSPEISRDAFITQCAQLSENKAMLYSLGLAMHSGVDTLNIYIIAWHVGCRFMDTTKLHLDQHLVRSEGDGSVDFYISEGKHMIGIDY